MIRTCHQYVYCLPRPALVRCTGTRGLKFNTVTEHNSTPLLRQLNEILHSVVSQRPAWQNIKGISIAASRRGMPGDYQTNAAMLVAKATKTNVDAVTAELVPILRDGCAARGCATAAVVVSAGGFINLTLTDDVVSRAAGHAVAMLQGSAPRPAAVRTLIDFSSPNFGKELHVGHLRSSVIGDTLARMLECAGARVTRLSHVGDAGVPIALVIAHVLRHSELSREWLPPLQVVVNRVLQGPQQGLERLAALRSAASGLQQPQPGDM